MQLASQHKSIIATDPVVENSTLSAVAPPDITYNLAMPASILSEGKLSNLQLEAIVYGCQRHMVNLPLNPELSNNGAQPLRAGFLLGDGAGMGKGRTLAGFVVENIARGRKRHIWISVSSDLFEGEQDIVVEYSTMIILWCYELRCISVPTTITSAPISLSVPL